MVEIREAVPEDNDQLRELQARCPQGTSLVVSTVYTPDFFARAKAYEHHRVWAAHEGNRIVGSMACALRDGMVNGSVRRLAYGFGAFVAPEHRGRGLARKLFRERQRYLEQQGVSLFYSLVMEGNRAPMRLLESEGAHLHRTLVMPGLAIYRPMGNSTEGTIRPASPDDLADIVRLLNDTWRGFELYEPASTDRLALFVARTPAYSLDNLHVLESGGRIRACLGAWEWSRIARMTLLALSTRVRAIGLLVDAARLLRPMPRSLRPGDTLRQAALTPIGFDGPEHLAALLRHVNDRALANGIEQLFLICERDHPLLRATRGFIRVDTAVHLFVKPLEPGVQLGGGPVHVDGIDL